MKTIVFAVTNNILQDQRIQRIASSLCSFYTCTIIGHDKGDEDNLESLGPIETFRISTFFNKGISFYLEFNIRLFLKLLFSPADIVVAIDLDTILACRLASLLRGRKFVFDAHEIFEDTPELLHKPFRRGLWKLTARIGLWRSTANYTVNESLRQLLSEKYNMPFTTIQNYPKLHENLRQLASPSRPIRLLYQGVLNEGRGLEQILNVLKELPNTTLTLVGTGDIEFLLKRMVEDIGIQESVIFRGFVAPDRLQTLTMNYDIGLNLLNADSPSYYFSSANKYFDYMMSGLPSINMAFPEYIHINQKYNTAILIEDLNIENIVKAIHQISTPNTYLELQKNCLQAREELNWEKEEGKLIAFYKNLV